MTTDLTRIQAAEGVFITDASTQMSPLITGTPAGTEAGLAVRDCVIGQNTMANSRPVVIASNQSVLTITGNLTNNSAAPSTNNQSALSAVATTAAPTYTTGNLVFLSTDLSGSLRVNIQSSITQANNITQWGGTATALGQTTMSASVPVTIASNQSNLAVVGSTASGASASGNPVQIGGIFNTTQPTVTTGQSVSFQSTARGAQIVATGVDPFVVINNQPAVTTGTITTSSSAIPVLTAGYNAVTISIHGTYAGVNFSFQASDDGGTTYYGVAATRVDTNQIMTTTGVLTANSSIMWTCYINAVTNFRVIATAYTSGTATINLTLAANASDSSIGANISEFGGTSVTLGQNTMANSIPVAIASNQTRTVSAGGNYSLSVGTSAVQLTAAAATQGVQIVADPAGGANYIYIGLTSGVTAGTNASTDGLKLAAGAGVVWPLSNANLVWAIASAVSQKIFVATF